MGARKSVTYTLRYKLSFPLSFFSFSVIKLYIYSRIMAKRPINLRVQSDWTRVTFKKQLTRVDFFPSPLLFSLFLCNAYANNREKKHRYASNLYIYIYIRRFTTIRLDWIYTKSRERERERFVEGRKFEMQGKARTKGIEENFFSFQMLDTRYCRQMSPSSLASINSL